MSSSIWILNEKGGTGKTTVSTVLVDHLLSTGSATQILDCDTQPDEKKRSSLSAIFSAAQRIDIGVSPDALQAKPSLAISHWDGLFELAKNAPILADFGANVAQSLLYWLDDSDIGPRLAKAGAVIDFVIVVTAQPDAVGDALALIQQLRAIIPATSCRLFVALNEGHGDFDSYADSDEMSAFTALVEAGELALLVVPKCTSEIWRDVERRRITALGATKMAADDLQALLGTPEGETVRGRKALAKWHKAVVEAAAEVGLLTL